MGPSTPLAAEVFTGRVAELAGSLVEPADELPRLVAAGARLAELRSYLQPFTAVLGADQDAWQTGAAASTGDTGTTG